MSDSKKIFISGIKLKDKGLKGLEVSYNHQEVKDGKTWNIEDWQDRKMPVGEKLSDVINAFRYYLLDVYGYDMANNNVADVSIKEIKFDGSIVITGELKALNGIRTVNLKTCKIDEDVEYEKMDELYKLVGQLKDEVKEYMAGNSLMSDNQLVMSFYKKKGTFDEAEFAGMTDDEKKIKATEILEKMGSLVIHNDDMVVGDQSGQVIDKEDGVYKTMVPLPDDYVQMSNIVSAPSFGDEDFKKGQSVDLLETPRELTIVEPSFDTSDYIVPMAQTPEPIRIENISPLVEEGEEEMFMIKPVKTA